MFKIISCGWNCEQFIQQTLQSVEAQTYRNFQVIMGYCYHDENDLGVEIISDWLIEHKMSNRYRAYFHDENTWDIPNRYEAINLANPQDDDIIVFLDLDGDRLLPHSLEYLAGVYAADPNLLMTYGNYTWEPHTEGPAPARSFPQDVVNHNTFRQYILNVGQTYNHLRTMKGRVFKNIPLNQFKWPGTDNWYRHGTDYVFTVPALELAGWRHRCLDEVLMIYNEGNPLSNVHTMWEETHRCTQNFLNRTPLEPLP